MLSPCNKQARNGWTLPNHHGLRKNIPYEKKLRWALGWFVYVWDISLKSMFVHQFNVLCISFLNTGNEEPRGSWSRKVNQGSPGSSKAIDNWSVGKEEQGRYLLYCHPFPLLSYPLSTALISDLRLMIAIETICVCNHLPLPIFFPDRICCTYRSCGQVWN